MKNLAVLWLAVLAGCTVPTPESSQARATTKRGILVMAHGGDAAWNERVEATVAPIRQQLPTEIAFGMARTSTMRDAVRRLEGGRDAGGSET